MPRLALALFATISMIFAAAGHAAPVSQSLVDGTQTVRFTWSLDDGRLSYTLARLAGGNETEVIGRSPLGLVRADADFSAGLQYVSAASPRMIDESYTMLAGKQREIRHQATEQTFTFRTASGALLELVVRVMDDGAAFRYAFPSRGEAGGDLLVIGEGTGFQIPAGGEAWMLPYDKEAEWAPSYEAEWQDRIPVGKTVEPDKAGWAFPALFHTRGHWVMITEAGLDGTCYAAHLEPEAKDGLYRIRLPEDYETYGVARKEARIGLPWQSPWRAIIVGPTPAAIVETTMITDLSPPCELADTAWIKAGRASWSWWSDKGSPADYHRIVPFIDLAADFGWEYSLVDGGWENMVNGSLEALAVYAKRRGVGLIVWYNSGGPHNQVMFGLRDRMDRAQVREAEMAWLERLGVKGIKVDFMQSDKQHVVQLYIDILRDAARHHLFVDFHGSTIPRGWARTFPNLLTQEGIRGAEQYWDVNFAEHAHTFHTIYTFTRNAVGSMDYTPVVFGAAPELYPHRTTNAHELATAVAFESGVQHYVDSVAAYRTQSDEVQKLLKEIPAAWDETRYVAGTPGDLSVIARRSGDTWYVSALNGRAEARAIDVPLTFLGSGAAVATIFSDGSWQKEIKVETRSVTRADTLAIALSGRGGACVRLAVRR